MKIYIESVIEISTLMKLYGEITNQNPSLSDVWRKNEKENVKSKGWNHMGKAKTVRNLDFCESSNLEKTAVDYEIPKGYSPKKRCEAYESLCGRVVGGVVWWKRGVDYELL
ncbi:hypothetical protein L1887_09153 [Cichorium endivia]|nr:hypothetical protein L1887_09153 [Cichorium endivia]